MKFTEHKNLDLSVIAKEILTYWQENNIFEKSIETREGKEPFVFFEGPPSANGLPGIHHVMARTIKDIFCRYKTQKGFQVKRKAGWDTHGLPVELGVEKELGITKEDIGKKISVEDYNKACKEAVMRYTNIWNDLTEKMGYWVDMENPYITYKSKYMESVWWLLKQIYNKGLLYKGYTIQPYSPKAGTGLSSHELNQPGTYRDVSDTTIVAQFRVKNFSYQLINQFKDLGENVFILAWTTTPWTLPSNTALAVGKNIDYVLVKTFNQYTYEPIYVILAKDLVSKLFGSKFAEGENSEIFDRIEQKYNEIPNRDDALDIINVAIVQTSEMKHAKIPYQILAEFKGSDLEWTTYEQLIPWFSPAENADQAFRVITGDFVTTEDGTGIVHIAPTFGADDARVAKENGIPPMLIKDENDNLVPLVDLQGRFVKGENVPELFSGKYIKNEYYDQDAPEKSWDVELAILLKTENKAFKVEKYVHSYPHCWRTDKPVLYYPLDSWFIKITDVKDRLFDLNKEINWKPKATGEGRFGNWLQNANDWNLSRSRYWGIPLPIWRTEDKKEEIIIGSVEELKAEIQKSIAAGLMKEDIFADFQLGNMSDENYEKIDLHKNVVDKIILVSASGKPMKRESDLIDVWFDSGAMPYAQWHYPFENKEMVENTWKTADFIAEGVDQTRGWFYTLHAIAGLVFDGISYKNVVSNGLVLDKNGQKMSKRLGNAIDPFTTLEEYGADATRWYMISNANPWDNLKFDLEGVAEVRRKFFGTLYNTYSFFALYANIDGFTYKEEEIPLEKRPEIDRWILSELHTLIQKVDEAFADYEPTRATRLISDFVQENLSNWYVRLCRRRFWKGEYEEDKISAYQTLYTCLLNVAKLMAPVAPFYAEVLYRDLVSGTQKETAESVHLTIFPTTDKSFIDKSLESKMEKAQNISSLVLSLRKKEMIKVRQPLQKIMIPVSNEAEKREIEAVADLIKSEVNVKEIELLEDASGILVKQIKPNFKTLGPRFGKDMKLVVAQIQNFTQEDIHNIEKNREIIIKLEEKDVTLSIEDVEITTQDIEGWLVASSGNLLVALDIHITDELRKEGIARELVNRIQNIRKDSGFDVTDKINICIQKQKAVEEAVSDNLEYIKSETLTSELTFAENVSGEPIEFDDIVTKISVEKV
ncbi:Isoleucine--tRNA ligase [Capnocytophaga canimorsus]|uniref:Isoleucine--tRNA ligase n=1 Tax=Capnocytophaga canimorsus TaxID=28188 RepID=A0A0B7HDX3_9FLAO|nr:isoleucine--tRNA ligase [Capnocytophaga canimorsus]ATA77546.1 isoleucine--tRNA ligase [Capnocytophaga canimorsus]PJI82526.1 isoleucyl-tRNA synthetase [Capnocytophaga canimorsus]CEN36092.1 Isoleucine--tRNA ligase [Capnocytophaga canimorsus]STA72815.1 Isoleucine--tRNA ligase [Capnocytophaga canimorsus]